MRGQDGAGITAGVARAFEAFSLKKPAEWLLVHRRWNSQPLLPSYESEGATR